MPCCDVAAPRADPKLLSSSTPEKMNHNMNYGSPSGYYGHFVQQQQQQPYQQQQPMSPRFGSGGGGQSPSPYGCDQQSVTSPSPGGFGNQNSPYLGGGGQAVSPYSQQYSNPGGYPGNPYFNSSSSLSPQNSSGGGGGGGGGGVNDGGFVPQQYGSPCIPMRRPSPRSDPNDGSPISHGLTSPQGASTMKTESDLNSKQSGNAYGGVDMSQQSLGYPPYNNGFGGGDAAAITGKHSRLSPNAYPQQQQSHMMHKRPPFSPPPPHPYEHYIKQQHHQHFEKAADSVSSDNDKFIPASSGSGNEESDRNRTFLPRDGGCDILKHESLGPGDPANHPGDRSFASDELNALERLKDLTSSAIGFRRQQQQQHNSREYVGDRDSSRFHKSEDSLGSIPELSDLPDLKFNPDGCGEGVQQRSSGGSRRSSKSEHNSPMNDVGNKGLERHFNPGLGEEVGGGVGPLQSMINNQQQEYIQMQGNPMQHFPMQMGYNRAPSNDELAHHHHQQQQQAWNHYGYGGGGYPGQQHQGDMSDSFSVEGGLDVGYPGGGGGMAGAPPGSHWWQQQNMIAGGGGPRPHSPSDMSFRLQGGVPAPGPWALRGTRPRPDRRGPGRPRIAKIDADLIHSEGLSVTPPDHPGSPYPPFMSGGPDMDMMPSPPTPGNRKRGPGRPRGGLPLSAAVTATEFLDPSMSDIVASAASVMGELPPSGKSKGGSSASSNKKRYVCEVCQKRFSTAWYVRVHRKSHDGERPYICHNCGKGFMLPNVLQVHLRKCEKNNCPVVVVPPPITSVDSVELPPGAAAHPDMEKLPPQHISPSLPIHPPPFRDHHHHPNMMPAGHQMGMMPVHHFGMGVPGGYNHPRFVGGYPSYLGGPPGSMGVEGEHFNPGGHESQGMVGGYEVLSPQQQQQHPRGPSSVGSPLSSSSVPYAHDMFSPGLVHRQSVISDEQPSPVTTGGNHFLASDRPPDEGGGGGGSLPSSVASSNNEKVSLPPGVNADRYCVMCEIQFEDKSSLEEHLRSHRPFSCDVCEKRFSQKCNLITHMRLHTGERPYPCVFCDKRFTQKGNLDAHLKTHTKEKPYPCTHCDKKFSFKSSMISHLKQSHQQLLNTPGISPLSGSGMDFDEDDISSIKQQLKYSANVSGSSDYHCAPSSPNNFSSGIPTPQSSLDSLSGSQHGGQASCHASFGGRVSADHVHPPLPETTSSSLSEEISPRTTDAQMEEDNISKLEDGGGSGDGGDPPHITCTEPQSLAIS